MYKYSENYSAARQGQDRKQRGRQCWAMEKLGDRRETEQDLVLKEELDEEESRWQTSVESKDEEEPQSKATTSFYTPGSTPIGSSTSQ
ncbi:hypothetical protein E2C01_061059 [Portunus trituberculatus]|uniref:Uncharacterized protein n=1 Tax=Portunus trituberculatus TaxID=210409 RepID=A0A5B7HE19_PORTR|nr:hypothetical protein [Portunus trituberculatus]